MEERVYKDPEGKPAGILVNGHSIPMSWCILCLMTDERQQARVRARMIFKNGLRWTVYTEADYLFAQKAITEVLAQIPEGCKYDAERRVCRRRQYALQRYARTLKITLPKVMMCAA